MGLGFTLSITCIGAVRELIGAGQLFGQQILPLADAAAGKWDMSRLQSLFWLREHFCSGSSGSSSEQIQDRRGKARD